MTKKKLLIWSDSPTAPTGFGIVAKNLFGDLHNNWEVYILGINYFGISKYDTTRWFIYSVDQQDPLGINRFPRVLADINPDKIILFQDIFNIKFILPKIKELLPKVPILLYFPIDGSPFNQVWKPVLDTGDKLITYTQWAIDTIHAQFPNIKLDYLYHGVDPVQFYPLPSSTRRRYKEEAGWKDKFVIISNNRFQPRKNLPMVLRASALFSKGYKVCKCGNYYGQWLQKCDLNGCGPEDVIETREGRQDTMTYVHANMQEYMMGPGADNSLAAHVLNAGFTVNDNGKYISLYGKNIYESPASEAQLNVFYNVADVNVSSSLGEGVGLSLIEASACGTTSVAPKHSSVPEMLGDTGHLIPNAGFINIAQDNGHIRPVIHVPAMVDALEIEYQKWLANGKKKVVNDAAIERANTLFRWDDKKAKLEGWLKEL
jgi:D-inositol-3-phosphate glycosyltransferase